MNLFFKCITAAINILSQPLVNYVVLFVQNPGRIKKTQQKHFEPQFIQNRAALLYDIKCFL